jgi:hypothetical protein
MPTSKELLRAAQDARLAALGRAWSESDDSGQEDESVGSQRDATTHISRPQSGARVSSSSSMGELEEMQRGRAAAERRAAKAEAELEKLRMQQRWRQQQAEHEVEEEEEEDQEEEEEDDERRWTTEGAGGLLSAVDELGPLEDEYEERIYEELWRCGTSQEGRAAYLLHMREPGSSGWLTRPQLQAIPGIDYDDAVRIARWLKERKKKPANATVMHAWTRSGPLHRRKGSGSPRGHCAAQQSKDGLLRWLSLVPGIRPVREKGFGSSPRHGVGAATAAFSLDDLISGATACHILALLHPAIWCRNPATCCNTSSGGAAAAARPRGSPSPLGAPRRGGELRASSSRGGAGGGGQMGSRSGGASPDSGRRSACPSCNRGDTIPWCKVAHPPTDARRTQARVQRGEWPVGGWAIAMMTSTTMAPGGSF